MTYTKARHASVGDGRRGTMAGPDLSATLTGRRHQSRRTVSFALNGRRSGPPHESSGVGDAFERQPGRHRSRELCELASARRRRRCVQQDLRLVSVDSADGEPQVGDGDGHGGEQDYDGTTTRDADRLHADGVVGGDVVTCSAARRRFATASVGTGKTVTVTGMTLGGAAAANYTLASTTATTTANITAVTLTPTVTAANKVYDGTTTATVTSCTLTGVVGGDVGDLRAARRPSTTATVGTGKTVTVDRDHAERRGGRQLHAGEHDGDDDGGHHGGDADGDGDGGEQGLRRDDGGDAHELHADRRASAATW